jgi:hypothetical protein
MREDKNMGIMITLKKPTLERGVSLGHALCDDGHPRRRSGQRGYADKGRTTRPRDSRVSPASGTRVGRPGL